MTVPTLGSVFGRATPVIAAPSFTMLERTWQQWLELVGRHALLTVIVILVAVLIYRAIANVIARTERRTHLDQTTAYSLRVALRWVVLLLTIALLLQAWGVLQNVWAAVTATVTLLAAGFIAVWSVLSNILCSIILMTSRPFLIGERIELPEVAGVGGKVRGMTLLFTILESDDGCQLQLPNNLLFQKVVKRHPHSAATRTVATPDQAADAEAPRGTRPSGGAEVTGPGAADPFAP